MAEGGEIKILIIGFQAEAYGLDYISLAADNKASVIHEVNILKGSFFLYKYEFVFEVWIKSCCNKTNYLLDTE